MRKVPILLMVAAVTCVLGFFALRAGREGAGQASRDKPAVAIVAAPAMSAEADVRQLPAARSAAAMMSDEPLSSLLVDSDRVGEERARYSASLAATHRAEAVDAIWSSQAERALARVASGQAIVQAGIEPQAFASECRSRMCRISATFADYGDAQDWANFFLTGTGGILARAELFVARDPNGNVDVLIFGARP